HNADGIERRHSERAVAAAGTNRDLALIGAERGEGGLAVAVEGRRGEVVEIVGFFDRYSAGDHGVVAVAEEKVGVTAFMRRDQVGLAVVIEIGGDDGPGERDAAGDVDRRRERSVAVAEEEREIAGAVVDAGDEIELAVAVEISRGDRARLSG